ncbi:MAG TPA: hypothetical protein VK195_18845 [Burkholderiaceae bacterium]|nr:hypothetical protein [Burkholderiaceae bacterium]
MRIEHLHPDAGCRKRLPCPQLVFQGTHAIRNGNVVQRDVPHAQQPTRQDQDLSTLRPLRLQYTFRVQLSEQAR